MRSEGSANLLRPRGAGSRRRVGRSALWLALARRPRRHRIGYLAERRAERYLRRQGLRRVARNYASRFGEIDLVMRDGATLVFVEVRYRGPGAWSDGVASVNHAKQRRLASAARHFLAAFPRYAADASRFDVIGVSGTHLRMRFDWVRDAFAITWR